jgi:outer membrane protein OmpA-like peptidoglycan-associated protein
LDLATKNGCGAPEQRHRLGLVWQADGQFDSALSAFEQAQKQARDADTQSLSIGRYAEVLSQKNGPSADALDLVQLARRMHSQPPPWLTELALAMDTSLIDQPFTRERVKRSFSTTSLGRLSVASIVPAASVSRSVARSPGGPSTVAAGQATRSLAFRLHFARNSSEISTEDLAKVVELAEGLSSQSLSNQKFWLVGHTDVTGDASYNQKLSESRAAAVFKLLVALKPALAERTRYTGAGEQQLLYPQANSVFEHQLNRRVQVLVEEN